MEGWAETMYQTMATEGALGASVFFVLAVVLTSFFTANLAVGVIYESYKEELLEEQEAEAKLGAGLRRTLARAARQWENGRRAAALRTWACNAGVRMRRPSGGAGALGGVHGMASVAGVTHVAVRVTAGAAERFAERSTHSLSIEDPFAASANGGGGGGGGVVGGGGGVVGGSVGGGARRAPGAGRRSVLQLARGRAAEMYNEPLFPRKRWRASSSRTASRR